ncbi:MAG: hypothetical protein M3275_08610 [Thermoproteota archaeon]|nr:hypothetical protein [Thermoproteota archaeon]
MAQAQLDKTYPCLTCKQEIKLARKEDNTGWDKFNLDGSTHVHAPKNKNTSSQQQQQQPPVQRQPRDSNSNLSKEIAAIKAQLLVLVSRLDRIEVELQTHVS